MKNNLFAREVCEKRMNREDATSAEVIKSIKTLRPHDLSVYISFFFPKRRFQKTSENLSIFSRL